MIVFRILLAAVAFSMLALFFGVFLYMVIGAIIYSFLTYRSPGKLGRILCRPFTAWGIWCVFVLPLVFESVLPDSWPLRLLQAILLLFAIMAYFDVALWPVAVAQAAFSNRHGDFVLDLAGIDNKKGNFEVDPVLRPVFYTVIDSSTGTGFNRLVDLIAKLARRVTGKAVGSPTPKPAPSH